MHSHERALLFMIHAIEYNVRSSQFGLKILKKRGNKYVQADDVCKNYEM